VTLTVTNAAGAGMADNAHALISAGTGLDVTITRPVAGRSCSNGAVVDCGIGDLPGGQSRSLTLRVRFTTAGTARLQAHLEQEGADADPRDDGASLAFEVRSQDGAPPPPPPSTPPSRGKPGTASAGPRPYVAALVKVFNMHTRGHRAFRLTLVLNRQSNARLRMRKTRNRPVIDKRLVFAKGRAVVLITVPQRALPGWYRLTLRFISDDGALRTVQRPVKLWPTASQLKQLRRRA
jgi:hypothetical protein